jgi:hypothetical protein
LLVGLIVGLDLGGRNFRVARLVLQVAHHQDRRTLKHEPVLVGRNVLQPGLFRVGCEPGEQRVPLKKIPRILLEGFEDVGRGVGDDLAEVADGDLLAAHFRDDAVGARPWRIERSLRGRTKGEKQNARGLPHGKH